MTARLDFARKVLPVALILGWPLAAPAQDDPYEKYVKTSQDFKPVKQDKDWALKAFPSWIYMPWYYQWTIGFDDAAGEFCKRYGYQRRVHRPRRHGAPGLDQQVQPAVLRRPHRRQGRSAPVGRRHRQGQFQPDSRHRRARASRSTTR